MSEIKVGDTVVFRGSAFTSGALTGHEQEGVVIGIKGTKCAIAQTYVKAKTRFLHKPTMDRFVVIRSLGEVIKDETGGLKW